VRDRLARLGLDVPPPAQRTPDHLGKYVAAQMTRRTPAVKASAVGME
jgi:hypothetical protein